MEEDAGLLQVIAARRRLSADEVVEVLTNHRRYGLELKSQPSPQPASGTLLLCLKKDLGRIKQDGVAWAKRGSTNKIREDHSKLKASSIVVRSHTCRAAASPEFGRRRYALDVPPPAGDVWLIHYLADTERTNAAAKSLTATCGGAVLSGEPALRLTRKLKNGAAPSQGFPAPVHEPASHCNGFDACRGGTEFQPVLHGGGDGCGNCSGSCSLFPGIGSVGIADFSAGCGGAGASKCGSWDSGSLQSSEGADEGGGSHSGSNVGLAGLFFAAGMPGDSIATPMSIDDDFHDLAASLAAAEDETELEVGESESVVACHEEAMPNGTSELRVALGAAQGPCGDLQMSLPGSSHPPKAPAAQDMDGMDIAEGQPRQQQRPPCLLGGVSSSQDACNLGGWTESSPRAGQADGGDSGGDAATSGCYAAILDFSPACDSAAGGAKILVCLASPLPQPAPAGFVVMFGEVAVPAEQLTPTALRCRAPPFSADGGSVPLRLALGPVARPQELPVAVASAGVQSPRFEYHPAAPAAPVPAAAAPTASLTTLFPPAALRLQQPPLLMPATSLPDLGLSKEANGKRLRPQWSGSSGGAASPGGHSVSSPMALAAATTGDHRDRPLPLPSSPLLRRSAAAAAAGPPQAMLGSPVGGGPVGVHGGGISSSGSGAAALTLPPGLPPWSSNGGGVGSPASSPLQTRFAAMRPGSGGGGGGGGVNDAWAEGRQHKIRIVERLGEIAGHSAACDDVGDSGGGGGSSSGGGGSRQPDGSFRRWPRPLGASGSRRQLSHGGASSEKLAPGTDSAGGSIGSPVQAAGAEDELAHLLDDAALLDPAIGDAELEELLEQLVIRVVSQLAQLASTDSTLQEELNCLDDSGYGLLHYTCLYSLGALVPVLLARGASVHQPTSCGQGLTPLHCAAMGGDLALAQALVQAGAVAGAPDASGAPPAQHAFACGHNEMGWWLLGAAGSAPLPPDGPGCEDDNPLDVAFGAAAAFAAAAGGAAAAAANGDGNDMEVQTVDDGNGGSGSNSNGWRQEMGGYIAAGGEKADDFDTPVRKQEPMLLQPMRSEVGQGSLLPSAALIPSGQSGGGSVDLGAGCGGVAGSSSGGGGVPATCAAASGGAPKLAKLAPPTTAQMLQDAFASLSLHEKCALTLSLQQQQQGEQDTQAAAAAAGERGTAALNNGGGNRPSSPLSRAAPWAASDGNTSADDASADGGGGGGGASGSSSDGQEARMLRDVSEVLYVGNEESLRAAMSMMAPSELRALDEEVKVIQGGVRAWLLRRNYRSLRAAAKALQLAWRERQRGRGNSSGGSDNVEETGGGGGRRAVDAPEAPGDAGRNSRACRAAGSPHAVAVGNAAGAACGENGNYNMVSAAAIAAAAGVSLSTTPVQRFMGVSAAEYASGSPRQLQRRNNAANTLQAATRGMLARRHFSRIKRETVALLVIQTNLRSWIRSARPLSGGSTLGGGSLG